ncbi:TP901 family phage tail tape measure protein [Virgibacillus halotolerans]|uniref:phage tail tape measure protein n=1 Tax=Virgibacillus halotolerans TaxID=1071053 RepID=UPI0019612725|nr:phage tail tape measure protein [Virgibacillus halotolerans]MBM7598467.1 TP901 family phage tail tape measure protein [Virgibacillus halotolerans]
MAGKNLGVKLTANTSQFKSDMSALSRQMKTVKNDMVSAKNETDKYGNRLQNNEGKVKVLTRQLDLQRNQVKKLTAAYNDAASKTSKNNIETQKLATRLSKANSELKKTEGELKRTKTAMNQLGTEAKKTGMSFKEFDQKFRDVGGSMRTIGMGVAITTGAAFAGLVKPMKDAVGVTMEFESGMSKVKAISGATGSEFDSLKKQAKELGRTTKFTASEAASGMEFLAMAGFEVNEITAAMPGLLDLAASSNMELGRAADIASNIISGFSMEADEAGRVSDVLARSASNANTDVEQMGDAMATVAPIANTLGLELEDMAAGTMLMSDAGIQGQKAGRMLRQGLIRLSKPTGEAADLIEDLGINVFDADGNMKDLDKVVAELEGGLDGMSSQAQTAALATLFGSESTAGWSALLDRGSDTLKEYTEDLNNSEGAASEMAETMQDNAAGAVTRLQSAFEGLQIEFGEKLIPMFGTAVEGLTDMVTGLSEMDEATMTTIAKTAVVAAGILGVVTAVATLTAAIGALMLFAGPVGLAIVGATAALGALGLGIYAAKTHTEEMEKANFDNAKSLSDQAIELEKNADTFDKLSDKAKISNDELAELHDLNNRIANAKNSDEVAKLQGQYDELAKKSGLSKDELKKLFEANDNIIAQSPDVEQSVSAQGNAFVDNTEAVREYIDTLYEMSLVELDTERQKALKEQEELQKKITKQKREQGNLDKQLTEYNEANKMSQKEIEDRLKKIKKEKHYGNLNTAEGIALQYEEDVLTNIIEGNYKDQVDQLLKKKEEGRENIANTEEEIAKNQALLDEAGNILLKQVGINEEGEKGLTTLEEKLAKNKKTLANLDAEKEKNGELNEKQQEKYDKLTSQNEKMEEAQDYIIKELELYGSVNSLVDSQTDKLSEGTHERLKSLEKTHDIELAEGNIVEQIQKKHGELVKERDQLEENREKQGANKKEIDKQIAAIDEKINTGDGVIFQMLKELDILELVKEGIQLNGDELQAYLEGLGYSTDEAFSLAQELSGETVEALKQGEKESKKAGKDKGDKHKEGLDSTREPNKFTATGLVDNIVTEFNKGSDKTGKSGKQKGEEHRKGIFSTQGQNASAAKTLIDSVLNEVDKGDRQANQSGKNKGTSHNAGLSGTKKLNEITGRDLTNNLLNQIKKGSPESSKAGKDKGTAHKSGLQGTSGANNSAASLLSSNVTSRLGSTTDGGGGSKAGSLFKIGLGRWGGATFSTAVSVASQGVSGLKSVKTSGAGSNFVAGFRGSINSGSGSVWSAAWSLGKSALGALRGAIKTASPSKETAITGGHFTEGFAIGIDDEAKEAEKSAVSMAKGTHGAMTDEIDKLARTFSGAAYTIRANKEVLKVEHEINNSGMENQIEYLSKTVTQLTEFLATQLSGGKEINQHITINSPDATSPADNARKIKQASRQLAAEWRR